MPRLFGHVCIPTVVWDELNSPMTPAVVRAWISAPPYWLSVLPVPADAVLAISDLDDGEQAAIALADPTKADLQENGGTLCPLADSQSQARGR